MLPWVKPPWQSISLPARGDTQDELEHSMERCAMVRSSRRLYVLTQVSLSDFLSWLLQKNNVATISTCPETCFHCLVRKVCGPTTKKFASAIPRILLPRWWRMCHQLLLPLPLAIFLATRTKHRRSSLRCFARCLSTHFALMIWRQHRASPTSPPIVIITLISRRDDIHEVAYVKEARSMYATPKTDKCALPPPPQMF